VTALHAENIEKILRDAMDRLSGNWVLVGGSLLVAKGLSKRATVDIDLIGLSNPTQKDTLTLMEVALENGIPVEALNQAASFFVLKIPELDRHISPWIVGKTGTLFQPDLYLYVRTKVGRLSETDVEDALAWIRDQKMHASAEILLETKAYVGAQLGAATDPKRRAWLSQIELLLQE
jgi:hypothetical protein